MKCPKRQALQFAFFFRDFAVRAKSFHKILTAKYKSAIKLTMPISDEEAQTF